MVKRPEPAEPLSRKDVQELLRLLREHDIQEFELQQGDLVLRVVTNRPAGASRGEEGASGGAWPAGAPLPVPALPFYAQAAPGMYATPAPLPAAAPAPAAAAPEPAAAKSAAPSSTEEDDSKFIKVTSPMVGTFYRSPAPNAKPYVEVGTRVEENTVLCIVEAMKLMNEIKAEVRGIIRRIIPENAQPVEYGQPLFLIEPV